MPEIIADVFFLLIEVDSIKCFTYLVCVCTYTGGLAPVL